jgi:hypothetical protein
MADITVRAYYLSMSLSAMENLAETESPESTPSREVFSLEHAQTARGRAQHTCSRRRSFTFGKMVDIDRWNTRPLKTAL